MIMRGLLFIGWGGGEVFRTMYLDTLFPREVEDRRDTPVLPGVRGVITRAVSEVLGGPDICGRSNTTLQMGLSEGSEMSSGDRGGGRNPESLCLLSQNAVWSHLRKPSSMIWVWLFAHLGMFARPTCRNLLVRVSGYRQAPGGGSVP